MDKCAENIIEMWLKYAHMCIKHKRMKYEKRGFNVLDFYNKVKQLFLNVLPYCLKINIFLNSANCEKLLGTRKLISPLFFCVYTTFL